MAEPMNPEVKKEWLAALRSGDYSQGRNVLETTDGRFCCLGVLCDLAKDAGVVRREEQEDGSITYVGRRGGGVDMNRLHSSQIALPFDVMEWAGLHQSEPEVAGHYVAPDGVRARGLTVANDHDMTFEQIADIIEVEF